MSGVFKIVGAVSGCGLEPIQEVGPARCQGVCHACCIHICLARFICSTI